MIKNKLIFTVLLSVTMCFIGAGSVKAAVCAATPSCAVPTACSIPSVEQIMQAQAAWNEYVQKAKATQAALSGSYADEIITLNQNALINQAALIHRFTIANPNPLSTQASADWAAINMLNASSDPYAMAITCNPYFYR